MENNEIKSLLSDSHRNCFRKERIEQDEEVAFKPDVACSVHVGYS